MPRNLAEAHLQNFLGHAPDWYKLTIIAFLVGNPLLLALAFHWAEVGIVGLMVIVASIWIGEVNGAFTRGEIDRETFEMLAVAINTGTNIPSIATPNGQAAFLFLLTSAPAPLIRLDYFHMVCDGSAVPRRHDLRGRFRGRVPAMTAPADGPDAEPFAVRRPPAGENEPIS